MNVPLFDLKRQTTEYRPALEKAISEILDNSQFLLGEKALELEEAVAGLMETAHGIACASGTDALFLALKALGTGSGDEVITTPFTFFATASAIARTGAKPVFADVDPDTLCLDPASAAGMITGNTKGILPVHLFGYPADMDAITKLAREKGLFVIEDAAQAIGTRYKDRAAGSFGDAAILSFYPTKNLGAIGDAGMVVTGRPEVAEKARLLRNHGTTDAVRYEELGVCSRMDALAAASLLVKLPDLEKKNARRREIAGAYNDAFRGLPLTTPPAGASGTVHIYHHYTLRTDKRDALREHLSREGIGSGVYYAEPLNVQPCFAPFEPAPCPEAGRAAWEVLQLPVFPELTDAECGAVRDAVISFFK